MLNKETYLDKIQMLLSNISCLLSVTVVMSVKRIRRKISEPDFSNIKLVFSYLH